jgi:hypothetical protein
MSVRVLGVSCCGFTPCSSNILDAAKLFVRAASRNGVMLPSLAGSLSSVGQPTAKSFPNAFFVEAGLPSKPKIPGCSMEVEVILVNVIDQLNPSSFIAIGASADQCLL